MLIKEEGVGINCSELRKAGQGFKIQEGTVGQEGLAVRTPWRCSSQMTALPQPSSVPSGSSGCQGSGDWRGALQASYIEGGRVKEESEACPTLPLPQPISLIRVTKTLGSTLPLTGSPPPLSPS